MTFNEGDIVFNKYKIKKNLNNSSDFKYFDSYRAEHIFTGRKCYLKVYEKVKDNDKKEAIFNYICRKMVEVSESLNVENVYDLNILEDFIYLDLEWGGGYYWEPSLGGLAKRMSFNLRKFLREMVVYAEALQYAHDKNFPHGSLMWRYFFKSNDSKDLFLAGFGHAASYSFRKIPDSHSYEEEYLISDGGSGYLSPCQIQYFSSLKEFSSTNSYKGYEYSLIDGLPIVGDRLEREKKNADIWAFGATMFHFLTGKTIHGSDEFSDSVKSLGSGAYQNSVQKELWQLEQREKISKDITNIILRCLESHDSKRYQSVEKLAESLRSALINLEDIDYYWGETEEMISARKHVEMFAAVDEPVLIMGGPGTGKEKIAEKLHVMSSRKDRPFIPLNCAGLPEGLVESELFGHVKGAFTGATKEKKGMFEAAENGTLFLDEVGELPPGSQAKLLRVLENREVRKVGGLQGIPINVRVVAATNRPLDNLAYGHEGQEGFFRKDLYERLNVLPIRLPDLKDRKVDIEKLSTLLFAKICKKLPADKRPTGIDKSAIAKLKSYDWPGNIRQLSNVITRAVALVQEKRVLAADDFMLPRINPFGENGTLRSASPPPGFPSGPSGLMPSQGDDHDDLYWFVQALTKVKENGLRLNNVNLMKYFSILHPEKRDKRRFVEVSNEKVFEDKQGNLVIEIQTCNGEKKIFSVVKNNKKLNGNDIEVLGVKASYSEIPMSGQSLNSYVGKKKTKKSDGFIVQIASNPDFYGCLLGVDAFRRYYLENNVRLKLPTIEEIYR